MQTVIERLRASKDQQVDQVIASGAAVGRKWAEESADYLSLKSLVEESYKWDLDDRPTQVQEQIERLLNTDPEFWADLTGLNSLTRIGFEPDPYFIAGFVKGARSVWEEVGSKI